MLRSNFGCIFWWVQSLAVLLVVSSETAPEEWKGGFYERPGIPAAEIIRQRGFNAEELYVTSGDGYVLRLTHATNPLINSSSLSTRKSPILFIHGVLEDSSAYVVNSFGAKPRDFSSLSLLDSDQNGLEELVKRDPSANSLPFLAMNFGHEVWLLNRRGTQGSQEKIKRQQQGASNVPLSSIGRLSLSPNEFSPSTEDLFVTWGAITSALGAFLDHNNFINQFPLSFDRDFWNFSLDEQAEFDFPAVLNYVSRRSGEAKVAVVGHSAGGTLSLLALSEDPQLEQMISSAILWSPAFHLGKGDVIPAFKILEPLLRAYIGPVPPAFSSVPLQTTLGLICASRLAQSTLCELVGDSFLGESGGEEPFKPQFLNTALRPTSSHELAQHLQTVILDGSTRKFDFGSRQLNLAKYRQAEPPTYNLSRVTLERISIYVGRTDTIVSPEDVKVTLRQLNVDYRFNLINTTFNHQGYYYHKDAARWAVIPSLKDIQFYDRKLDEN